MKPSRRKIDPRFFSVPMVSPDDAEVQAFIAAEMLNFNPLRHALTARELFAAARERFGDLRCDSVEFWSCH